VIRLLIVEDEEVVARRLERLLTSLLADRGPAIRRASSLAEALAEIAEREIDLLFLDLNLNGRSGFEVLAEAVSRRFQTIIVSAHEEQAISAFEYGVTDFVPKPFTEARLQKALDRVFERHETARNALRYLAVRRAGVVRPVRIEDVVYIQGAGDYAEIHCRDGSTHLHDKSLTALEHLLPSTFVRIHRSFVVSLRHVEALRSEPGSRYSLRLSTGQELPVSRTRVAALREHLV
jgi:DNA-binding LytR/AlgR family response regulator